MICSTRFGNTHDIDTRRLYDILKPLKPVRMLSEAQYVVLEKVRDATMQQMLLDCCLTSPIEGTEKCTIYRASQPASQGIVQFETFRK